MLTITVFLLAMLLLLDKFFVNAGLWTLVFFSVTVGYAHGALDALLLLRRYARPNVALRWGGVYLLWVVILGSALGVNATLALWLLLLMSAWHFGEPYARWEGLGVGLDILTRFAVGGAPVMLPMVLAKPTMEGLLSSVYGSGEAAAASSVWHWMSVVWLALTALWGIAWLSVMLKKRFSAPQPNPTSWFWAWLELAGVLILYLVFSPLMAFALYFGIYHAPVHVWRVWRLTQDRMENSHSALNIRAAGAAFLMTVVLAGMLWWWLSQHIAAPGIQGMVLRWLIVALAALTFPHLVLISLCERMLAGKPA